MYDKSKPLTFKVIGAVFVTLLLMISWFVQPVFSTSPASMPQQRPTLPSGGGSNGGGDGEGDERSGGLAAYSCAGIRGTVINWGYQNEPNVTVKLEGNTYDLTQVTASDGKYDFRGLGQGYAIVQPLLIGMQENLKVHTDNVAVRLHCDEPAVLNLGVYSGNQEPQPPAYLSVSVNETSARLGDKITFRAIARNTLPTPISNVMITDLFPTSLKVIEATSTRGTPEVLDKQMVSLYLASLGSNERVALDITVQIQPNAPRGRQLINRTSLMYAESMADQVVSSIVVGEGVSVEPGGRVGAMAMAEETGEEMAVSAASVDETPAPELSPTPQMMAAMSLAETTEISPSVTMTGTEAIDGRLPETGVALNLTTLPLIGLGLAGIAFLAKFLRGRLN